MATTPPAGPDRIASLPWKKRADDRPPADDMNRRRGPPSASAPSSRATRSTYRRRIGVRYASATVVSPRGTNFTSGIVSWLVETCAKPSARAMSAIIFSCRESATRA